MGEHCKQIQLSLFRLGPQHGFHADRQDNMIESPDARHPRFDVPIFSLYSDTREPTADMLDGLDRFIIDLPDLC